jgi:hypothetical protein
MRDIKTKQRSALGTQCCFCGQPIIGEQPLIMHLELPQQASQSLWAHGECMRSKLHPSVPFLTPKEHDE